MVLSPPGTFSIIQNICVYPCPSVVLFNLGFPENTHPIVFEKLDSFLWNLYWHFPEHRSKIPCSGRSSPRRKTRTSFRAKEAPTV